MPSPLRNWKTVYEWIEHDYFLRPRLLPRLKRWLGWIMFFLLVAAAGLAYWWPHPSVYQAAPVSAAHQLFSLDCKKCHTEPFQAAKRFWPGSHEVRSVPDHACSQCHAGPIHHEEQVGVVQCAVCHREHQGRPALAKVPDADCISCHQDLKRNDSKPSAYLNVTSFVQDHPDFTLFQKGEKDSDTLRFNHSIHLKGVRDAGPSPLPLSPRERGRGEGGKIVQLECANCHRPKPEGGGFLPLNYQEQCSACHPLLIQIQENWKTEKAAQAAARFRALRAPHKDPLVVRGTLRERYVQFAQQYFADVKDGELVETDRPIPGKRRSVPINEKQMDWVNSQMREEERFLFDGAAACRYCHKEKTDSGRRPGGLPEYFAVSSQGLRHARFNHVSHRMLNCAECHDAIHSAKASDILIPHIDNCKECHNPQRGVRWDCSECHLYHDRTKGRGLNGPWTIPKALEKTK